MVADRPLLRPTRPEKVRGSYILIVRGPDGVPRAERFGDVAAYRARLAALPHPENGGLSIDEIAGLLDT